MLSPSTPTSPSASPGSRDLADLSSHDAFVDGVPHRTFETLRREDPVAWFEERDGSGFWALTRHADIVAANRSYRRFSSHRGIRLEEMSEEERAARLTMMEHDPPEHTRLRRFANRGFARPLIETYEKRVRDLVIDVLDKALVRDEFDCVSEIAKPLPLKMLASVLGVSEEDGAWLAAKGDEMIGNSDPDFTDHVVDRVDTDAFRLMPFRSPAAAEVFEYAERQAAIRRRQPRDDVIGLLLEPLEDGKPLGDLEFKNFFTLLIAAGNDTTRYAIASAIHVLANRPPLFEQLRGADGKLWSTAVEELLRTSSPTMHFRRTATEDCEMHGRTIRAGDKVILWFISGNHDERVFEDPFRVDLARDPNPHMAFGRGGPHACLGMWLARLELRVVLQELAGRIRSIRQAGPDAPDSGMSEGLPDMEAVFDLDHVRPGWEPGTGVVVAELEREGRPFDLCARGALKRAVERWREKGPSPSIGIELEAFVFQRDASGGWTPCHTPGAYVYGTGTAVDPEGLLDAVWAEARTCGFPLEAVNSEYDWPQFEFTLRYRDALGAIDDAFLFRLMAREVVAKRGYLLTFMPKPLSDRGGNGLHVNLSLADESGGNAFADPAQKDGLSDLARRCIAGLLHHHRSMSALLAPTVNSYRRLRPASLAGYWANWGYDHRGVTVRVPGERGPATRLEHRLGDGAANPYVAAAAALHAARLGVEHGYALPAAETGDGLETVDTDVCVPENLGAALDVLEGDGALICALGERLVGNFIGIKRKEWDDFLGHTTDWELSRYLDFV